MAGAALFMMLCWPGGTVGGVVRLASRGACCRWERLAVQQPPSRRQFCAWHVIAVQEA